MQRCRSPVSPPALHLLVQICNIIAYLGCKKKTKGCKCLKLVFSGYNGRTRKARAFVQNYESKSITCPKDFDVSCWLLIQRYFFLIWLCRDVLENPSPHSHSEPRSDCVVVVAPRTLIDGSFGDEPRTRRPSSFIRMRAMQMSGTSCGGRMSRASPDEGRVRCARGQWA